MQSRIRLIRNREDIVEIFPLQGLQEARESRPGEVLAEVLINTKEIHFPLVDGGPTWQKAIAEIGFTFSTEQVLKRRE